MITLSVCFVCLFVCPRISPEPHVPIFVKSLVHVIYDRGSVLLWKQCDTLCTSGFVDDVMFAHNGRYVAGDACIV